MLTALDRVLLLNSAKGFWLAFLPAALLAMPILNLLIRLKSTQTVSEYLETHQKKQGTPTMGGIIVIVGVTVAGFALWAMKQFPMAPEYLSLFIGFALIGFVDDFLVPRMFKAKRGLGWKQKILMQVLLATLAVAIGGGFVGWQGWAEVFLILFCSNAYNFADGLDGLAGSVGVLILGGLAAIGALVGYSYSGTVFAACLVGALVPFIVLNSPPAKVFMGDVGSLPIGAVMGLMVAELAIPATHLGAFDAASEWYLGRPFQAYVFLGVEVIPEVLIALFVLCLLLAAELVPVPLQIASVKLRGKRMFTRTPIHHGFEAKGWPESRVVWRFALVQLVLAAIAVTIVLVPAVSVSRSDPTFRTAEAR